MRQTNNEESMFSPSNNLYSQKKLRFLQNEKHSTGNPCVICNTSIPILNPSPHLSISLDDSYGTTDNLSATFRHRLLSFCLRTPLCLRPAVFPCLFNLLQPLPFPLLVQLVSWTPRSLLQVLLTLWCTNNTSIHVGYYRVFYRGDKISVGPIEWFVWLSSSLLYWFCDLCMWCPSVFKVFLSLTTLWLL